MWRQRQASRMETLTWSHRAGVSRRGGPVGDYLKGHSFQYNKKLSNLQEIYCSYGSIKTPFIFTWTPFKMFLTVIATSEGHSVVKREGASISIGKEHLGKPRRRKATCSNQVQCTPSQEDCKKDLHPTVGWGQLTWIDLSNMLLKALQSDCNLLCGFRLQHL